MKELTDDHMRHKVEITEERQSLKTKKLLGQMLLKPGLNVYEFDEVNMTIQPVRFEGSSMRLSEKGKQASVHRTVKVKENCRYIQALNLKNALKKLGLKLEKSTKKNNPPT